ncbi:DNA repair and recombination protein RAD54 and RAD54-like protein [Rhizoctonia solani AG-1 IB]|uniref:DNA repair and recombination protein RAD54 and RAD54-like protein n=1 Tax=Thanatephorus cucumeris (strain AG1-IB / isolate 7/3/14) TaxID=1108050 RepID=M5BLL7_THACB|nr:DNA repair and recombination protein RAD54 and RAD54-like protein [Rhizoctonia solani AG-1 IB]
MYIAKDGVSLFSNPQVLVKPFKSPAPATPVARPQPQRKRKRVVYKEQGSDSESDSGGKGKKNKNKKKPVDDSYQDEANTSGVNINKLFPTFGPPKPITGRFSLPSITDKSGNVVPAVMTNVALGIRPAVKIPPRPLHDPMADHAIVLFDPTIDTRETDEERKEREKLEAAVKAREEKEKAALEAGAANLYNPHKSLRELLGGGKDTQLTVAPKVPVVIDPKLGKILRPHQIEGVKVCSAPIVLTFLADGQPVFVSMYHRNDSRESIRVYHGRRDGSRQDIAVHCSHVDPAQAVSPRCGKRYY